MDILDKILLTEILMSLVSLFLMGVSIDTVVKDKNDKIISYSKQFVISGIIMFISFISIVVTLLIRIWMV